MLAGAGVRQDLHTPVPSLFKSVVTEFHLLRRSTINFRSCSVGSLPHPTKWLMKGFLSDTYSSLPKRSFGNTIPNITKNQYFPGVID